MNTLQVIFYVALPLAVGVAGVAYGEVFRARATTESRADAGKDQSIFTSDAVYRTIRLMELIAAKTLRDALKAEGGIYSIQQPKDWKDEVHLRHGNILLKTLRQAYGQSFAAGFPDYFTLGDVLRRLDSQTLEALKRDYASGQLDEIAKAE